MYSQFMTHGEKNINLRFWFVVMSSLCSFVKRYYALEESASSNFIVEEWLMFIQPQERQRRFLPNVSTY